MSNRFLDKAVHFGNKAKAGADFAATAVKDAWADTGPAQRLGMGIGITGLAAKGVNDHVRAHSLNQAEQERIKLEQKNLKALQSIHEALTNGK